MKFTNIFGTILSSCCFLLYISNYANAQLPFLGNLLDLLDGFGLSDDQIADITDLLDTSQLNILNEILTTVTGLPSLLTDLQSGLGGISNLLNVSNLGINSILDILPTLLEQGTSIFEFLPTIIDAIGKIAELIPDACCNDLLGGLLGILDGLTCAGGCGLLGIVLNLVLAIVNVLTSVACAL